MPVPRESLFRVFHADYRTVLWQFFANRHDRITPDLATEFADSGTLGRMLGLELLEYDGSEYRLDDRIECFIEDMLGAAEVAPADWLTTLIEEVRRLVEGHQKLASTARGKTFLNGIVRKLRTCDSRAQRHLEEINSVVDLDYRAGSDYEVRQGLAERERGRRVRLTEYPPEEVPPVIDWQDVAEAFIRQSDDLFVFLRKVCVEGRSLTEDEVIDGFCAILSSNERESWDSRLFDLAFVEGWEYAVVRPFALSR